VLLGLTTIEEIEQNTSFEWARYWPNSKAISPAPPPSSAKSSSSELE
jgi:hypothetical protein